MTDNGDLALYANQIKYALMVVSTLPILILHPFLQKFFDEGVMIGALKGKFRQKNYQAHKWPNLYFLRAFYLPSPLRGLMPNRAYE